MTGSTRALSGIAAFAVIALPLGLPAAMHAQDEVASVIAEFKRADPGIEKFFRNAHGCAVFPTVGKGGIGIGGARGTGWVYERGILVGRSTLTQVTIGFQLGGQAYSEIIFFKDKTALDDFTRGNFELGAQASAVAVTAGASANLSYNGGVAIVTRAKGGLMYEASVGGQKFSYRPVRKGERPREK
jgi:lipid-binding SYLF domain-containing protein